MSKSGSGRDRLLYHSYLRKIKSVKDKHKRLVLIKELAGVEDTWASDVLLDSLDDASEKIRALLVQELGKRKNLDLNLICQKLSHPQWFVKSSALRILGLRGDKNVLIHIEALLSEPNVDVRRAIAASLGNIGGKKSLLLLLKLTKDNNHFVRASAEKAIQKVSRLKFTA